MTRSICYGESVDGCTKLAEIHTIKVGRVEATISLQNNESTMEIDKYVDTTVLGSYCLPIHDF